MNLKAGFTSRMLQRLALLYYGRAGVATPKLRGTTEGAAAAADGLHLLACPFAEG
jgi:hypothetical protein